MMSLSGRARPPGSVKKSSPSNSANVNSPQVHIPPRGSVRQLDPIYPWIQGSAMALPSPRPMSQTQDRRKSIPSNGSRSRERSVTVSHEACDKEIKRVLAREAQLKEQIGQLKKEIAELTVLLGKKDNTIKTLTTEKNTMAEKYQQEVDSERDKHSATQQELTSTQSQLRDLLSQLTALQQDSKDKMEQLQQMKEVVQSKDNDIADRDQTLERLKKQMADSLKNGSVERQHQLEELGRDLIDIKTECDTLRYNLKMLSKTKASQCDNCAASVARAEKLAVTLKEREVSIKDLKSLCQKFETQLSQQDVLLKQWAESKGYRP